MRRRIPLSCAFANSRVIVVPPSVVSKLKLCRWTIAASSRSLPIRQAAALASSRVIPGLVAGGNEYRIGHLVTQDGHCLMVLDQAVDLARALLKFGDRKRLYRV